MTIETGGCIEMTIEMIIEMTIEMTIEEGGCIEILWWVILPPCPQCGILSWTSLSGSRMLKVRVPGSGSFTPAVTVNIHFYKKWLREPTDWIWMSVLGSIYPDSPIPYHLIGELAL